ncbi:MAG: bile acid:sodium symporter family protein [Planctomycetota bacterium]
MTRLFDQLANAFPIWVLVACGLALVEPGLFTWFRGNAIVVGLAVIMLGMGLGLSLADFQRVTTRPTTVAAGFAAQFLIMPTAGWLVAETMQLDTPFAVGLILVGCCPGGTASNVVTYLARADVALSVLMTTCSTLGAVVLTPLLTQLLAGKLVAVDGWGLFLSTLQVVVLPVVAGMAINRWLPGAVQRVLPVAPLVSVVTIALVCASIVGQNAAAIRSSGPQLLIAVFLLHAIGFGVGYLFARLLGYDRTISRTISIEVGMQNSGLGVVLAQRHFPAEPLTAVPCAISSVTHSVIGSLLAGWWRLRGPGEPVTTSPANHVSGSPPL